MATWSMGTVPLSLTSSVDVDEKHPHEGLFRVGCADGRVVVVGVAVTVGDSVGTGVADGAVVGCVDGRKEGLADGATV